MAGSLPYSSLFSCCDSWVHYTHRLPIPRRATRERLLHPARQGPPAHRGLPSWRVAPLSPLSTALPFSVPVVGGALPPLVETAMRTSHAARHPHERSSPFRHRTPHRKALLCATPMALDVAVSLHDGHDVIMAPYTCVAKRTTIPGGSVSPILHLGGMGIHGHGVPFVNRPLNRPAHGRGSARRVPEAEQGRRADRWRRSSPTRS